MVLGDKKSLGMKPELFAASCTALSSEHQHGFGDKKRFRYETRVICSVVYGIKFRTPAWFWGKKGLGMKLESMCTALSSKHQHGFGGKPELFAASCTALSSEHQHGFGDKRKCRYETRVICSIVYGINFRTPAWFWG